MFRFQWRYFILAVLLFLTEITIAVYLHDDFVRPYVGDFLVVILMYSFVISFFNLSVVKAAIGILIVAYLLEIAQYFKFVRHLGLQHFKLANIVFGNTFEWGDMAAYT